MKRLSVILLSFIIFNSCKKSGPSQQTINGVYAGSFERKVAGYGIKSTVTITFSPNTFTGTSDSTDYPAICNGNYSISGDTINFQNQCNFPANFDWNFILTGQYSLNITGDSLSIIRGGGDFVYVADVYKLKKQ